jgi:hypothetical protein
MVIEHDAETEGEGGLAAGFDGCMRSRKGIGKSQVLLVLGSNNSE